MSSATPSVYSRLPSLEGRARVAADHIQGYLMAEDEKDVLPIDEAMDHLAEMLRAQLDHTHEVIDTATKRRAEIGRLSAEQRSEELVTTWNEERQELIRSINDPWERIGVFMGKQFVRHERQPERADIHALSEEIYQLGAELSSVLWSIIDGSPLSPTEQRSRPSTRKIETPWDPDTLYPTPNLQGNGTRNLGRIASGDVAWTYDPNGAGSMLALVGESAIGRVDLSPGREGDALKSILEHVASPRALKTIVGVSRLVWEKTERKPLNRIATVTLGELARAAGYEPGPDRNVKAEIRQRLGKELRALCAITTWASDGPYDKKTRKRPMEWVAPLLSISAVLLEQLTADEGPVPVELDVMLGRNWAAAYSATDLVQIAPGFMKLHDDNVIRLGWFYQTEFRYRMTAARTTVKRTISSLCEEAVIDPGETKHRGRFLERLDKWHAELLDLNVIGAYGRTPSMGSDTTPGAAWARGMYTVRPPKSIMEAYADTRAKALARKPKRPTVARPRTL